MTVKELEDTCGDEDIDFQICYIEKMDTGKKQYEECVDVEDLTKEDLHSGSVSKFASVKVQKYDIYHCMDSDIVDKFIMVIIISEKDVDDTLNNIKS